MLLLGSFLYGVTFFFSFFGIGHKLKKERLSRIYSKDYTVKGCVKEIEMEVDKSLETSAKSGQKLMTDYYFLVCFLFIILILTIIYILRSGEKPVGFLLCDHQIINSMSNFVFLLNLQSG